MAAGTRRGVAGGLLAVLLLVAAAAAAAAGGGPAAAAPSPVQFYDLLSQGLTVLIVALGILTVGTTVWALWRPPAPGRKIQGRGWALRSILFTALLVGIALRVRLRALRPAGRAGVAAGGRPVAHSASSQSGLFSGSSLGYLLGLLVLALLAAYVVWRWRRTAASLMPPPDQALRSLDAAVAELQAARDPREAVVRAYAAMERSFAGRGLARALPEVPGEYLDRLLRAFPGAGDACRRLTSLYHHARFSPHPVGPDMRSAAERELQSIRVTIQAASGS